MTAPTRLYYFQCRLDQTLASSPIYDSRYRCVACGSWMRFLFAEPITTPEHQALAVRGLVFNPHTRQREPWTCVRCGQEFRDLRPRFRADGTCCAECATAERPPVHVSLDSAAVARDDEDRMEAAYRAVESQQEN